MAQYSNYKKVSGTTLPASSITASQLNSSGLDTWTVKWFYGSPNMCSPGCCCAWVVPTGVRRATIELWGAGGTGGGGCTCNRCYAHRGAQGGFYNTKTIDVTAGDTYTVCAGGVYPCLTRECCGCNGCASFVNGTNLSNFCAPGGHGGINCNSWAVACHSVNCCCIAPGSNGGDFAMGNHTGGFWNPKGVFCHCHARFVMPTAAPFIGTNVMQGLVSCWIRCGCWTVPYGHGGQSAMSTQCGSSCCGQAGTGGPGLVKITFV